MKSRIPGINTSSGPAVVGSTAEVVDRASRENEIAKFVGWVPPKSYRLWKDPLKPATNFREFVTNNQVVALAVNRDRAASLAAARYRGVAPPEFDQALNAGMTLAETGAGLGAGLGPAGAIGGAVAGFVGGLVSGIIPFGQNAAEERWRSFVSRMTPVERYALLVNLREVAIKSARAEGKVFPGGSVVDPCGPWRWADDPELGHSPWGGPISRTVFCFEIVLEFQCIPSEVQSDDSAGQWAVAVWAMCMAAGAHDDRRKLRDMRALWPRLERGTIAPFLADKFRARADTYIGTLRDECRGRGVPSIWNPPVTEGIERALKNGSE